MQYNAKRGDAVKFWLLILATGATIFVLTFGLVMMTSGSTRHSTVHVDPIPSTLPLVHQTRQLAADACDATGTYESHLGNWRRSIMSTNLQPIGSDSALKKITIGASNWPTEGAQLACIIRTSNADTRVKKLHSTWGHKCDSTLYVTNKETIEGIPPSMVYMAKPAKGDTNPWQVFRMAIHHAAITPELHARDFFLIASDHSFIIVENLRKMLAEPYIQFLHSASSPLLLGHRMVQSGSNIPFVSGTSFILNRAALDILVAVADNSNCDPTVYSDSVDMLVATCLRYHNIYPLNTQDVFGEDRLQIFDLNGVASIIRDNKFADWYPPYRRKAMPRSLDGVSKYTFHIHGIQEDQFQHLAESIGQG